MNDGEALRRAVLAAPDEDTPRLVYADWLDENGQGDRAALIRAQIEVARAEPFGLQARAAQSRVDALLDRHYKSWTRHLRGVNQVHFERGFVGRVQVETTAFVPAAPELFASEPIQSLRLLGFTSPGGLAGLQALLNLPQLRQVRRLEFTPLFGLASEEYAVLSGCPNLVGLRDLSFRENPVPPGWLASVLAGQTFPELQGLDFGDIPNLGPGLAAAFSGASHRDIRRLDVSRVVFKSDQLQQLLQSKCLRRAEDLRLRCPPRRSDGGPLSHLNLGWVIPWERLTVLDLSGQGVGSEGVKEIVRNTKATPLRLLGLAHNDLDSGAVRDLTEAGHLKLSYLDVRGNSLSPSDLAALKRRFPDTVIES